MQQLSMNHRSHLAGHVETNLYRLYQKVANLRRGGKSGYGNYEWVDGSPSYWPSYIYNSTLVGDDGLALLSELEKRVLAREIPSKLIISGSRISSEVLQHLQRKFQQVLEWTGMVADFDSPYHPTVPKSDSLEVRSISSEQELRTWAELVNLTFFGKQCGDEPGIFAQLFHLESIRFYLGYWEGTPVATSMGFADVDVMGVYNITTLERYRGHGLGTAMSKVVLEEGRRLGCKGAILQSRPTARGVYASLGFQPSGPLYIFDLAARLL